MKSQTLTFPAPITYIDKVKVTSPSKDASGFYDELNQQQYNALQAFKEQLTKENILSNFDYTITYIYFVSCVQENSNFQIQS